MKDNGNSNLNSTANEVAGGLPAGGGDGDKVTIVVPLYNAESGMVRCIDSILKQTYRNLELILINDGSTDNSAAICDSYARQDPRVRVIHQENSGVSAARNAGIAGAAGKYIQFVDSDDYIDKHMVNTLVKAMEQSQASLVICGYRLINSSTGACIRENYYPAEVMLSFAEFMKIYHRLYATFLIHGPWNKLYRTDMLRDNNLLFDLDFDLGEDFLFNLKTVQQCSNFMIISECLYNYTRPNSGSNLSRKRRNNLYQVEKRLFAEAMSLYKELPAYTSEKTEMEMVYARVLLILVLNRLANLYGLKQYRSFIAAAREIRADEVLNRRIDDLCFDYAEDKLFKFLMRNRLYGLIFVYHKMKNRWPAIKTERGQQIPGTIPLGTD